MPKIHRRHPEWGEPFARPTDVRRGLPACERTSGRFAPVTDDPNGVDCLHCRREEPATAQHRTTEET